MRETATESHGRVGSEEIEAAHQAIGATAHVVHDESASAGATMATGIAHDHLSDEMRVAVATEAEVTMLVDEVVTTVAGGTTFVTIARAHHLRALGVASLHRAQTTFVAAAAPSSPPLVPEGVLMLSNLKTRPMWR